MVAHAADLPSSKKPMFVLVKEVLYNPESKSPQELITNVEDNVGMLFEMGLYGANILALSFGR